MDNQTWLHYPIWDSDIISFIKTYSVLIWKCSSNVIYFYLIDQIHLSTSAQEDLGIQKMVRCIVTVGYIASKLGKYSGVVLALQDILNDNIENEQFTRTRIKLRRLPLDWFAVVQL